MPRPQSVILRKLRRITQQYLHLQTVCTQDLHVVCCKTSQIQITTENSKTKIKSSVTPFPALLGGECTVDAVLIQIKVRLYMMHYCPEMLCITAYAELKNTPVGQTMLERRQKTPSLPRLCSVSFPLCPFPLFPPYLLPVSPMPNIVLSNIPQPLTFPPLTPTAF